MSRTALHTALVCIGFVDAAVQAVVEEPGIKPVEESELLSDDEIVSLRKMLCHPRTVPAAILDGGAPVSNLVLVNI